MAEVGFYHLTRSTLLEALPQLLVRTLAASERALVLCREAAELDALSTALWEHAAWLPHGRVADGDPDLQPIWLSTEPVAANGARFLFLLDGGAADRLAAFVRVFDLFDGNDAAAVAAARLRWTAARSAGHALTYWQQSDRGWQKKFDTSASAAQTPPG